MCGSAEKLKEADGWETEKERQGRWRARGQMGNMGTERARNQGKKYRGDKKEVGGRVADVECHLL